MTPCQPAWSRQVCPRDRGRAFYRAAIRKARRIARGRDPWARGPVDAGARCLVRAGMNPHEAARAMQLARASTIPEHAVAGYPSALAKGNRAMARQMRRELRLLCEAAAGGTRPPAPPDPGIDLRAHVEARNARRLTAEGRRELDAEHQDVLRVIGDMARATLKAEAVARWSRALWRGDLFTRLVEALRGATPEAPRGPPPRLLAPAILDALASLTRAGCAPPCPAVPDARA